MADRAARPRRAGGPCADAGPHPPAGRERRDAAQTAERPVGARQHHRGARRPRRPRRVLDRRATAGCAGWARELRPLRTRLSESLPDLVDEVARTLGLETELASAPGVSPAGARAHLDALHGVAAEFTELAELPSLPAFLGYLRDAEERERGLEPGEVAVNPEAVQLLTGHSARVSSGTSSPCPGMTKDQFPAKADTSDSWIKDPGAVPAELRLTDREELPAAAAAGARLRRPGGGEERAGGLRPGVEGLRHRRGDPARLRRRHPRPPPAGVLGQLVARRQDRLRPLVAAAPPCATPARTAPATIVHWAERAGRRRDQPGAGGVADRAVAGRPALRPADAAR